jgi:hypothetical protein
MGEPPRRSTPKRAKAPPEPKGDGENERPTINPPFDVEAFARASAKSRPSPPGEVTRPPPPPAEPVEALDWSDTEEPRSERITMTNEVELERARARSADEPGSSPASPKSANEPPRGPPSILSMANARAPSAPSAPPARSLSPSSIEAAVLGAIESSPPPEITERTIDDPVAEMRGRFSLGDYTGALEMAELLLAEEPGNLEAAECGENCRTVLEGMYAARLGPLDRVPLVVVPRAQMRWLSIDHRAGFVLSLIDGSSSIEMILDVSGMPKLDALRILHELVQQKIVSFR